MASKKPKSFLSSFLKILTIKSCIFNHFTKFLSFYLFFIFIFGFYTPHCEATFYYRKYNYYNIPGRNVFLRRVQRSPFLPPTVTSFKPAIKKSSVERNKQYEKVSSSRGVAMPPIVASQSLPSSPKLGKKVPVKRVPNVPQSEPVSPVIVSYPRPPMVIRFAKKEEPKVNISRMELTVTPQNDQHTVNPQQNKDDEEPQKEIIKLPEISPKNESKKMETKPQETSGNDVKSFVGLNEVLDALDITIEDLRQVLKRVGIPLETFLAFIDKEKTKHEIMAYLNLPESLKNNFRRTNDYSSNVHATKTIPYSIGVTYDHKYNRGDRQKELVDHLPITEIVHEVPLNREVTYKDPVQHKSQSEKYPSKKGYKEATDNEFTEKKYKSKRYKPNYSEKNPYLMNSDMSTMFPSKDSPIITSFWPPKKKSTKPAEPVRGTASIVSLTIEERITDHRSRILHETTLPIRSKVLHTNSETSTSFPNTEKNWTRSSYEQQQANLRAVFPVRGFIMFLLIFGLFAFFVIAIFVVYGAIKCNRKPTSSTYELSEHQEQDGSTSSVITNT